MNRIMDLCRKLDIEFDIRFDHYAPGFIFHFSKKYDSEIYHVKQELTLNEYHNSNFDITKFIDALCVNVEYNFKDVVDTNIESILTRADVIWCDDMLNGVRVVKSRNSYSPLTPYEKEKLKQMWKNQGIHKEIIFTEVTNE